MMKLKILIFFVILLFTSPLVWAQQPPQPPPDPLAESLFPPELIMQHQQAIGLSEDQKNFIKSEIRKAQVRFIDLQFQLQDETEAMVSLVKQDRVDEKRVLAQLDKILNLEREIKQTHFSLVIRIKNKLTPEQQAQLREIKNRFQQK